MSRIDPNGNQLPRGVIYDPARQRYRVRFYQGSRVVYLNYAHAFDEAMTMYDEGLKTQEHIRSRQGSLRSSDDYIDALRENLV